MAFKQTDNRFLATKLALRRHFIAKYHATGPLSVFDACAGDQVIWTTLRKGRTEPIEYFGADRVKTKLKLDSAKLCAHPAYAQYDIIDIDTYGSPWTHFFNLLPNIKKPTTIFLTWGKSGGLNNMSHVVRRVMGLDDLPHTPNSLLIKINSDHGLPHCLGYAHQFGLEYEEIKEAFPRFNARYFGARIIPSK